MIVIVDYGMGNLRSVQKAFERVGSNAVISSDDSLFPQADALVFPGQGSFPDAVRNLEAEGLMEPLRRWVDEDKPFLGICLGLQLLFERSEEGAGVEGLGCLKGEVVKFPAEGKIPHMGWNTIKKSSPGNSCPLLDDIPNGSHYYFVHSYYIVPEDETVVATTTDYMVDFASMVWRGNLYAMQFHPEKSQHQGLAILEKFHKLYS